MPTPHLGLKNDFVPLDLLPAAWLNAVAEHLDAALPAGRAAVELTGETELILSAAQYGCLLLELTGTLAEPAAVVLPHQAGRCWLVRNLTAGGHAVTVRGGTGTGVAVPPGALAPVLTDGSDFRGAGAALTAAGLLAAAAGPAPGQQHTLPAVAADTVVLAAAAQSLAGKTLAAPRVQTGLLDTAGNTLLAVAPQASAVNHVELRNAAAGAAPRLAAAGADATCPLELQPGGSAPVRVAGALQVTGALDHDGSTAGFFGVPPAARPAALTRGYTTADRTLGAYTPDPQNSAYGGLPDGEAGTPYASVADLNALRAAVENLRQFTEDAVQLLNAVVSDLQSLGLEQ